MCEDLQSVAFQLKGPGVSMNLQKIVHDPFICVMTNHFQRVTETPGRLESLGHPSLAPTLRAVFTSFSCGQQRTLQRLHVAWSRSNCAQTCDSWQARWAGQLRVTSHLVSQAQGGGHEQGKANLRHRRGDIWGTNLEGDPPGKKKPLKTPIARRPLPFAVGCLFKLCYYQLVLFVSFLGGLLPTNKRVHFGPRKSTDLGGHHQDAHLHELVHRGSHFPECGKNKT